LIDFFNKIDKYFLVKRIQAGKRLVQNCKFRLMKD
jgi:hypothetical protein